MEFTTLGMTSVYMHDMTRRRHGDMTRQRRQYTMLDMTTWSAGSPTAALPKPYSIACSTPRHLRVAPTRACCWQSTYLENCSRLDDPLLIVGNSKERLPCILELVQLTFALGTLVWSPTIAGLFYPEAFRKVAAVAKIAHDQLCALHNTTYFTADFLFLLCRRKCSSGSRCV